MKQGIQTDYVSPKRNRGYFNPSTPSSLSRPANKGQLRLWFTCSITHRIAACILLMTILGLWFAPVVLAEASTQPSSSDQASIRPDYPVKSDNEPKSVDWIAEFRTRLKPLSRPRGERWP